MILFPDLTEQCRRLASVSDHLPLVCRPWDVAVLVLPNGDELVAASADGVYDVWRGDTMIAADLTLHECRIAVETLSQGGTVDYPVRVS